MANAQDTNRNIEIWKTEKLITSLESAHGNGNSMISVIIPPHHQIYRIKQMLEDEFETISNIESIVNRESVLDAIAMAHQRLELYNQVPENGLVLYIGTIVNEHGSEKMVTIDFEPFQPINASLYVCDNKFHTEALNELLECGDNFGFVYIIGNGTLLGTLSGNAQEVPYKLNVNLPLNRGRRRRSLTFRPKVSELIVAGSAILSSRLPQSDIFDPRLHAKIMNVFDVSYNQATKISIELLANAKFTQEKHFIDRYFEEIHQDNDKYVFGVDDTLTALEMGAMDTLIVWKNLDIKRYTLRNITTDEMIIKHLDKFQEDDQENFRDLTTNAELEVVEKMSLVKWLANEYRNFGCAIEFVTNKSRQGSQFCRGFGGIGGILRYQLDIRSFDEVSHDDELSDED